MRFLDGHNLEGVTLIKIDAEGCELDILHGAMETIKESKPAIFIEANTIPELHKIYKVLAPLGYWVEAKFNATPTYEFIYKG